MSGKRLYTGDIPCPGCGRKYPDCRRHYKESICFDCERDLSKFQEIKQRTENQKDTYVNFEVNYVAFPYLSMDKDYNDMISSFRYLFELLDTPAPDILSTERLPVVTHGAYYSQGHCIRRREKRHYRNGVEHSFIIREDIALALDALLISITAYAHKILAKGKAEGANLLKRLGDQDLTPDEFVKGIKSKIT